MPALKADISRSQNLRDHGDIRAAEALAFRTYQNNPHDIDSALNLADIYLENRKKQLARPLIVDVLAKNPRNVAASVLYARYYIHMLRPADAIKAARYAISIDPKYARAWYFLARAQKQAGLPEFESSLKQALALDPAMAPAWAYLASIRLKQGKFDEAIQAYEKAARVRPQFPDYPFNIGVVYYERKMPARAREQFLLVAKKFPKYENAYINLGLLASDEHKLPEAEQYFRKATLIAPTKGRGWAELTGALVAQAKFEEAIITARRATLLAPNLAETRYALSMAEFGLDMLPQAQLSLQKAIELQLDATKRLRYQHFLVVVMFMNGKVEDASKLADSLYKANPGNVFAARSKAWALMCLKKYDEGFAILRKAMVNNTTDVSLLSEYMAGLSSARRYSEAKQVGRKIVALSPDNAAAWIVILESARKGKNRAEELEALSHLKNTHLDSHTLMEIGLDTAGSTAGGTLSRALMQNPENADLLLNTRDPRENMRGLHSH